MGPLSFPGNQVECFLNLGRNEFYVAHCAVCKRTGSWLEGRCSRDDETGGLCETGVGVISRVED